MYNIENYNYILPEELIAQEPALTRDSSRLLFVERSGESLSDHRFYDLPRLLKKGDLLVVNNTRVVPAKLFGKKASGGKIEILVLEYNYCDKRKRNSRWCLLKSSKRPKIGCKLFFEKDVSGRVEDLGNEGLVKITFESTRSFDDFLSENGIIPLPHYIKRKDKDHYSEMDRERYQTIFSSHSGAVAAPTAGLHFTMELIERLKQKGVDIVELTLHVGHGTFKPVRVNDIREHKLGAEAFSVSIHAAHAINQAKKEGRRVIAVGTTVVRTLESAVGKDNKIMHGKGQTDLLITPGFKFRIIDGLITNFHLPKSSLLFLVSSFGGLDLIKKAYFWAVDKKYRFFSYGDAMLLL